MNKKFLTAIAVLAVAMFLVQYRMPHRFSWEESFNGASHQPFGCLVLDSLLSASLPQGYSTTGQTPWQLYHDKRGPRALIVNSSSQTDQPLMQMAREGWHILLLMDGYCDLLTDSLSDDYSLEYAFSYKNVVEGEPELGRIRWVGRGDGHAEGGRTYAVLPQLVGSHIERSGGKGRSLAQYLDENQDDWMDIAVSYPIGRGEIVVLSAPLLMTNYGVLNDECRPIVERLIGRLGPMPVVRIDPMAGMRDQSGRNEQTPLIVFLERPPLRMAVYLSIVALVLFVCFTARRRQRVIPVVEPPKNNNMEFVRLIGTLYYHRRDHRGLLQKKWAYTAEEVRRLTGIDLEHEDDAPQRLAQRTGLPAEELSQTLAEVRLHCTGTAPLSDLQLRQLIDRLKKLEALE